MLFMPKKWTARFPASLLGLILATLLNWILSWSAPTIGSIPQTLLLDQPPQPCQHPVDESSRIHRAHPDDHRAGRSGIPIMLAQSVPT
jgi:MFS superfamily sulfate permease-like transporter